MDKQLCIGVNTLFLIPSDVGGTETYVMQVLQAMLNEPSNNRFVLFCNNENLQLMKENFGSLNHVKCISLSFNARSRVQRIIREQIQLPIMCRKHSVDVLWSPGYTAPLFLSCPQAVTIHDMQYRRFPEDLSFVARTVSHLLITQAAKRADAIITVSEFSKSEIVRFIGVAQDKVHVTLEAADEAFATASIDNNELSPEVRSLIAKGPFLLTVGHSYPHKNIDCSIRAFGRIADRIPHDLVIVGKARRGEDRVQEALGLISAQHRVHRLSNVSRQDIIALYQSSAAFVFSSLYEGFGLPVLEALLAGTPVICFACASIPEVAGECAVYVQEKSDVTLADSIVEVIGWESKKRREFIDKAEDWAKSFQWHKAATQTANILTTITRPA